MKWKLPLSDVDFDGREEEAVLRIIRSGWLSMGPETDRFESEFAEGCGTAHALACSNGTSALHMALAALGVGPGDAVLQPAVNFVSAANMTIALGASPVLVDITALDTPTLSPIALEAALESLSSEGGMRAAAVVVMHYGGYPCDMDAIQSVCTQYGVPIVEDACHAVGGWVETPEGHKRAVGALGDVGCFSFFSNKNLVTGEGGMVTTDRNDIEEKIHLLRSHGMSSLTWDRHRGHASTYDVTQHGFNYRIDEIRSALGRIQLSKLQTNNERRRLLTRGYWDRLGTLESRGWTLPFRNMGPRYLAGSTGHIMPLVAPDIEARAAAADGLRSAAIQTSLHYPAISAFTAFRDRLRNGDTPLASSFCQRVLTVPLFPGMSDSDVETVTSVLLEATK